MSEAIIKYWPIITALVTLIFGTGGFYIYVKLTIANINRQFEEFKDWATNDKKDMESKFKERDRIRAEQIERLEKEFDKDFKRYEQKIESAVLGLVKFEEALKNISGGMERFRDTSLEIFSKIDEIKKDFVSTTHLNSIIEPIREDVKELQKR